jgi:membrane protein DedA with SNARE-associated domain
VADVDQLRGHLLLAAWVLFGSAIPFMPTGEMVSGAAAVASHSQLNEWLIFLITWVCSVLGDTILLLEARLGAGFIRPRLERSKLAARVRQAERALSQNSFNAIVTGRLIPGGRTPVIAALGLSRYPIRRFLPATMFACGLWAGIYSAIGTIGGKVAHHPVWATVVAVSFAVCMGLLMTQIRRFLHWRRTRRQVRAEVESDHDSGATADRLRQS